MNTEHICFKATPEDYALLKQKGFSVLAEQYRQFDESKKDSLCVFNTNSQKLIPVNLNVKLEDSTLLDSIQTKYNFLSKGEAFHVICNASRGISETAESTQIQVKQELSTATYIPPMPIAETQQEQTNRLFKNDGYCPFQKRMVPISILMPNCQICKDSQDCTRSLTKTPSKRDHNGDRVRETLFLKREASEADDKRKQSALETALATTETYKQKDFERDMKKIAANAKPIPLADRGDFSGISGHSGKFQGVIIRGHDKNSDWLSVNPSCSQEETPTWIKDSRQKDQEEMRQRYIEQLMTEKTRGTITSKDLEELRQLEKIEPIAIAKIELQQEEKITWTPESQQWINDVSKLQEITEWHALTDKEESDLNAYFYFLHFCLKCNRAISPLTGNVIIKATSDVHFEQSPAENLRNLSIAVLGEVTN